MKKPAGARPGMVIYSTCQTLFVTPEEELVKRCKAGEAGGIKKTGARPAAPGRSSRLWVLGGVRRVAIFLIGAEEQADAP